MSDVCEALSESARLLRSLAGQSEKLTTIYVGPSKRPADGDEAMMLAQATSVHDLATRLEGGAMELKRLRAEMARLELMGNLR